MNKISIFKSLDAAFNRLKENDEKIKNLRKELKICQDNIDIIHHELLDVIHEIYNPEEYEKLCKEYGTD